MKYKYFIYDVNIIDLDYSDNLTPRLVITLTHAYGTNYLKFEF